MNDSKFSAGTHHLVFITDQPGIGCAFQDLKIQLVQNNDSHVSLIYFAQNNGHLFVKELGIMHSHFPDRFLAYFEESESLNPGRIPQETLESVINENTRDVLRFYVIAGMEFADLVNQHLIFLGIQKSVITMQEINRTSL